MQVYAYIKGLIAEKTHDTVTLENNGIGYILNTSRSTLDALGEVGASSKLYTYLHVREDIFSLFGFLTRDELKMFLLLLSVSGVGPKAALSILSALSPSKFSLCVIIEDAKTLTQAQGVGSKLAQRIILELKDKFKKENIETALDMQSEVLEDQKSEKPLRDAMEALLVLGYSRESAMQAVHRVYQEGMELEFIIKSALKQLSKT